MEQYIKKSALVAEIKRRAIGAGLHDGVIAETREDECHSILSLIDTLEVKEMDSNDAFIEKASTWIANRYQANGSYLNADDIEDFEKYMKGE